MEDMCRFETLLLVNCDWKYCFKQYIANLSGTDIIMKVVTH